MTEGKTPAKSRAKKPAATTAAATIVPSSPEPIELSKLRRAAENVRHTRVDEDVASLALDIAAHGLLQSLIGYRPGGTVQIVGGGRRFQALRKLEDEGKIDGTFPVPVLVRDVDEAVELSLAENLQQRTMSPVDEFLAFRALMERGDTSPNELAKRFGFSERVVKQRLRLADLAPEVLDALAERKIAIDAAMAYAATQDRSLQVEIFKAEAKKPSEPHRVRDIKHAIAMKGIRTDSPLFKFVGEDAYTLRGGEFEDDLFNEAGKERALANPGLLMSAAREMIDFQMLRILPELQKRAGLAPTIAGYVIASDLRIKSYGNVAPKPPAGFVQVERWSSEAMWRTIRNNGIDVHVLVGINDAGELTAWPRIVFVPKAQKNAVDPPQAQSGYQVETPEQRAAREREAGVARWARRLAVGPFTGTPFEGRAFWPRWNNDRATILDGRAGWTVMVEMFVSDEQVAEHRKAAEKAYEEEVAGRERAERAEREREEAEKARVAELEAMDPPAVVVVDGEAWARSDDGSYATIDEDGDPGFAPSWAGVLANYPADAIGDVFDTREAFDAAMSAAIEQSEMAEAAE